MNTQDLRGLFPVVDESKIINMTYSDGAYDTVLGMLERSRKPHMQEVPEISEKEEDTFYLWAVTAISEEELERRQRVYKAPRTNREERKRNLEETDRVWIKKITIDGCSFAVSSASESCLGEQWNVEDQLYFLYMLGQGLRLGTLEEVPLERLFITHYELSAEEPEVAKRIFEHMDSPQITVQLSVRHITIPVYKRLRLKTGDYARPKVVHLTGEAECTVYIHGISFFDAWEDAQTRFEDPRYRDNFTEERIAQLKQEWLELLPELCPKGCVLPLVEYECDLDYQMQFYSSEYLRRAPKHQSAASFFMMHPDKETGPMGYRARVCELEPVPAGFTGELPVELFACYKMEEEKERKAGELARSYKAGE